MAKQKPSVISNNLSYEYLNDQFPPDKKYSFFDGTKRFGKYLIGVMDVEKMGKQTPFLNFAFSPTETIKSEGSKRLRYGDLKFHISLPERDRILFVKGCNIIIGHFVKHEVGGFKVVRDHERMSYTVGQEGKDFTIYTKFDKDKTLKDWKNIFETITRDLVKAGVPPGYRILFSYVKALPDYGKMKKSLEKAVKVVKWERKINAYFYYRYEKRWPKDDPLKNFALDVAVDKQPDQFKMVVDALKPREKEKTSGVDFKL